MFRKGEVTPTTVRHLGNLSWNKSANLVTTENMGVHVLAIQTGPACGVTDRGSDLADRMDRAVFLPRQSFAQLPDPASDIHAWAPRW